MAVKGYKVTRPNGTSKHESFLFEVGKTYKFDGKIEPCARGFHFCKNANDCFNFYDFHSSNKVFEVEATGECIDHDTKTVTSEITVLREISWMEVLTIVNMGKDNTGRGNSGDSNSGNSNSGNRNSGDWNSGNWNSGDSNSGDWNSGYRNSGDWNSGNRNSGYRNSGNRNSGYRNSGDWNSGNRNSGNWNSGNRNSGDSNSGNWNSGNRNSGNRNSGDSNSGNWNSGNRNSGDSNSGYRNSGAFCTEKSPVLMLFDKPSKMTVREWEETEAYQTMYSLLENGIWVYSENMTDEEKKRFPSHETTGGYLKMKTTHEMWADAWHNMDERKRSLFTSLENFDPAKFLEITGIDVTKQSK